MIFMANPSSQCSDEPAHPCRLSRAVTACKHKEETYVKAHGEFRPPAPLDSCLHIFNPLYLGNPYWGKFTNSENPGEMPHNAAFHHGLHCLQR